MFERLNQYQIMWVFVHFDLPSETKKDKKNYREFRQVLLKDGFAMIQYSIYARHCSSRENAEVHKKRIKNQLPPYGDIVIFEITDAQFGKIEFYKGMSPKNRPDTPQQLEIF
jgi:CRISPR-associated protein Cas2